MKIKAVRDLSEHEVNIKDLVKYAHRLDACIDLVCCEPVTLNAGGLSNVLVHSGIAVELPISTMGLILPRSGHAMNGIHVLGGVIDEGYRGEIIINLINHGKYARSFPVGTRIAQLLVLPYCHVNLEWVEELSDSSRGETGHGSTGI